MLTLFISFTNSSDVPWPRPKPPQNLRFPALVDPAAQGGGDRAGWGESWAVAREQEELRASVSLMEPPGRAADEPGAAPPVASGSHYGLSRVLPDQPLPNRFQHHFWFFSGDALCPARLPAHLQAPHLATCRALSGCSRWENDKWPETDGWELLGLRGGVSAPRDPQSGDADPVGDA